MSYYLKVSCQVNMKDDPSAAHVQVLSDLGCQV